MSDRRRLAAVRAAVLFLCAGCATTGMPPGNAQRGYVVWGFVGQNPHTPAAGQPVTLLDAQGRPLQTVTTDALGKYAIGYHPAGQYALQVGQLALPVVIAAADQRLDIDLSNPQGAMNYAVPPPAPPAQAQGQSAGPGSSSSGGTPSLGGIDPDAPAPGTDCWAAAGCTDYDSSTDTYTYESPE